MVAHFDAWLDEAHGIHFDFESGEFRRVDDRQGERRASVRPTASGRCSTNSSAAKCTARRSSPARSRRSGGSAKWPTSSSSPISATKPTRGGSTSLPRHGIAHEVVCNSGGKGVPARAIIERHGDLHRVFVDDLAVHHASVAKHAPEVHRLHMVAEPRLAPVVPTAPARPCADRRLADALATGSWKG